MTSTSGRLATGLKKCSPTKRCRADAARRPVSSSSMLDVLVAIDGRGGQAAARDRANSARFASAFSTIASMTKIGGAEPAAAARSTTQALRRPLRPRRARVKRLRNSSRSARQRRRRRTACARSCIVTSRPAQRAPGRDVAAHRAGADDVHAPDRGCPSAPSCAAARAARTRAPGCGKSGVTSRLPIDSASARYAAVAARAVALPKIDDRVRSRVVVALRALAQAGANASARRHGRTGACVQQPPNATVLGVGGRAPLDRSPSAVASRCIAGARRDRRARAFNGFVRRQRCVPSA